MTSCYIDVFLKVIMKDTGMYGGQKHPEKFRNKKWVLSTLYPLINPPLNKPFPFTRKESFGGPGAKPPENFLVFR